MAMEFNLVPLDTVVEEDGAGESADISASTSRTFFCTLYISDQIEQESIDVSVWGSPDAANWGTQPILKLPQRFYRGETRAVLELSYWPEVKFIQARWQLNRWGRVAPLPMFKVGLHLAEVPAMPQQPKLEAVPAAQ